MIITRTSFKMHLEKGHEFCNECSKFAKPNVDGTCKDCQEMMIDLPTAEGDEYIEIIEMDIDDLEDFDEMDEMYPNEEDDDFSDY